MSALALFASRSVKKRKGRKRGAGDRNASSDHGSDGTVVDRPFSFVSYHLGLIGGPYEQLPSVGETRLTNVARVVYSLRTYWTQQR